MSTDEPLKELQVSKFIRDGETIAKYGETPVLNLHTEFMSLDILDELTNRYLSGTPREYKAIIHEFREWIKQNVRERISRTQSNNS